MAPGKRQLRKSGSLPGELESGWIRRQVRGHLRRQGQRQERTEWHDIVAFDRLADLAQNYLKKGKSVFIEGRLQTRSWEDPQGQKRYRTEVVANGMQFLDARPSGEGGGQYFSDQPQSNNNDQASSETPDSENNQNSEKEDYIKDDIPF